MLRTSRELVAKVLNMFKNFLRFFRQNMFKTFATSSCECRKHVAAKFWRSLQCKNFATLVRLSYECRTIVARQSSRLSGEKIKLSDIRTNVVRHSHECLVTVVRMKTKLKLHSWERRETISRKSRDCHTTVARLSHDKPEIYFQN